MFIKTIKVKKPTFAVIGAVLAALALLAVIIVTVVRISSPAVYEMKSEAQRQAFLKEMGWAYRRRRENLLQALVHSMTLSLFIITCALRWHKRALFTWISKVP